MKHIFVGAGSIGQRHMANLRALQPDAEIIIIDLIASEADYPYPEKAKDLFAGNVVYICSPTELHYHHFALAIDCGAYAIFMEKPLFDKKRASFLQTKTLPRIAVGYQYRYHPLFRHIKETLVERLIYLHIYGSESIYQKYGVTPLETMLSHSIDLALWICGNAKASTINDGGIAAMVAMRHTSDITSFLHADMASSFRVATCTALLRTEDTRVVIDKDDSLIVQGGMEQYHSFIEPDNQMYIDEMQAWLHYLDTGESGDLCTFPEALQVQKVMLGK